MIAIDTVMWETQVALYDALVSNKRFMYYIGDRLYDSVPTNEIYPYVKQGFMTVIPWNVHNKKGYQLTRNLHVYTKAESMGNYPSFLIFREMNKTLHKKKFPMPNYKMVICTLDGRETVDEKEEVIERRIIDARYRIFVQEK